MPNASFSVNVVTVPFGFTGIIRRVQVISELTRSLAEAAFRSLRKLRGV